MMAAIPKARTRPSGTPAHRYGDLGWVPQSSPAAFLAFLDGADQTPEWSIWRL